MPASRVQRQQIPVAKLLLDVDNPRLASSAESQADALRQVAARDENALLKLAEDVVANGLDPLSLLAVMPSTSDAARFVALEGNRRLSALISLENPSRIEAHLSAKAAKRLEKLAGQYEQRGTVVVDCAVFPDRESANHWIRLRHTGQNEGVGTVPWGTDEQDRFRATRGNRSMAGQVVDFLQARGLETTSEGSTTADYLTTLQRLLSSPKVRAALGVTLQKGQLLLTHAPEATARALDHVVQQLRTKRLKVDRVMTREQREDWADRLPVKVRVAEREKIDSPVALDQVSLPLLATPAPRKRAASEPDPFGRKSLVPKSTKLNLESSTRSQVLFGELKNADVEKYPNLVSVGFRVFLEFSLDLYFERPGAPKIKKDSSLMVKIREAAEKLRAEQKITLNEYRVAKRAAEDKQGINASAFTFNQYVHNAHWHPEARRLKTAWAELEPFIRALWP